MRILHPRRFPEPLGPVIKTFHTQYFHRMPTGAELRTLRASAGTSR
ncbi:MAG TPA: hypothetical protein VFQ93_02260 [Casimicrobiaceae bacterium]|nr:hypothetical protein [Casimicrobiaceae bacterium]